MARKRQSNENDAICFVDSFGCKARVILDCFQICIDKPSSHLTRAETWSHYRHHNTVKFLLAILPPGVVTFPSKAYGGRAADKVITEESGRLDYGDIVLTDRGFLMAESAGMHHAYLVLPAFTKGKTQLLSHEVE